jgi:16S rRNA (uracil1498-N3)-methyltransferase
MQIFYEPEIVENGGYLDPVESNHCVKVLRKREGDVIHIINGQGQLFEAEITDANARRCQVRILTETKEDPPAYVCHIAFAPTKNIDRTEWFVEKSTEIGIGIISPIFSMNSERRNLKNDRLDKIITSAVKQSGALWRPILNELADFKTFIKQSFTGDKFIAHCHEDGDKPHLQDVVSRAKDTLVLIGPEGDFGPDEVKMARDLGFRSVSLGSARLRTETAALVACHIINLKNA